MFRLKLCWTALVCLMLGMAVQAQSANNGAWQVLQNGAVSLRVPADWQMQPGLPAAADATGSTTISINVTLLAPGATLTSTVAAMTAAKTSLLMNTPVSLPAGAGWHLVTDDPVNGQPVRTMQYFVTLDNVLVNVTGVMPGENPDALNRMTTLFDRIAATLTIDDPRATQWTRYRDGSGSISVQAPPDWLQKSTGDKVLTVILPEANQIVTLNYRILSRAVILEDAAQMLLDAYQEQNITVAALEPVSLPAGEAYRALLLNVPAQTTNSVIQTQQYQYILVRDTSLILINGGCETAQFEKCQPLIEQMVDTIVFEAP